MEMKALEIVNQLLPALSGDKLTYNAKNNVFLTTGYTSIAGNTYYRAIRISKHLVVYYELGEGYIHTFLNGISLYAWNGEKLILIAKKSWGGCGNWRAFYESTAKQECIYMLKNYLASQTKALGRTVSDSQLLDISQAMMDEVQKKRLTE